MDSDTRRPSRRQLVAGLACTVTLTACGGSDSGGGSAIATVLGPTTTLPAPASGTRVAGSVTEEVASWQKLIGTQFTTDGFAIRLTGVDAAAIASGRPADLRQQVFTATFTVDGAAMAGEKIYAIANSNGYPIFLSRSATSPNTMFAVFG